MLMNASINKFSLPATLFINSPLVPIMLSSNFLFLPLTILNNKNIVYGIATPVNANSFFSFIVAIAVFPSSESTLP
jgi:hypothetical protein